MIFLTVFFVVHWINNASLSKCISNYLAGSTDFGNVSFKVPGIHPFFYICTDAFNHTEEYTEAAGTAARCLLGADVVSCDEIELHNDQTISAAIIIIIIIPGHLVCLFSFYLLRRFIFLLHSFSAVPGAEKAQLFTLRTAKALAMTAVDVVCCPDLLGKVREDFKLAKLKQEKLLEGSDTAFTAS